MTEKYQERSQWERLVIERHPTAKIEKHGKQYRYASIARTPPTFQGSQLISGQTVGEFRPEMTRGGGLYLPSSSGRGEGWVS